MWFLHRDGVLSYSHQDPLHWISSLAYLEKSVGKVNTGTATQLHSHIGAKFHERDTFPLWSLGMPQQFLVDHQQEGSVSHERTQQIYLQNGVILHNILKYPLNRFMQHSVRHRNFINLFSIWCYVFLLFSPFFPIFSWAFHSICRPEICCCCTTECLNSSKTQFLNFFSYK